MAGWSGERSLHARKWKLTSGEGLAEWLTGRTLAWPADPMASRRVLASPAASCPGPVHLSSWVPNMGGEGCSGSYASHCLCVCRCDRVGCAWCRRDSFTAFLRRLCSLGRLARHSADHRRLTDTRSLVPRCSQTTVTGHRLALNLNETLNAQAHLPRSAVRARPFVPLW